MQLLCQLRNHRVECLHGNRTRRQHRYPERQFSDQELHGIRIGVHAHEILLCGHQNIGPGLACALYDPVQFRMGEQMVIAKPPFTNHARSRTYKVRGESSRIADGAKRETRNPVQALREKTRS